MSFAASVSSTSLRLREVVEVDGGDASYTVSEPQPPGEPRGWPSVVRSSCHRWIPYMSVPAVTLVTSPAVTIWYTGAEGRDLNIKHH